MVNKPACLYREDAQRAFDAQRRVLLDELRLRREEAMAAESALHPTSLTSAWSHQGPPQSPINLYQSEESSAERLRMLLRARQASIDTRHHHHHQHHHNTSQQPFSPISAEVPRYPTPSPSFLNSPLALPITRPLLPYRPPYRTIPSPLPLPPLPTAAVVQSPPPHLRGRSIHSNLPELLYAHLDTGFFFECYISTTELGSYISQDLFHQIAPTPLLTPCRPGDRLRFNGESYESLGYCTFSMKMTSDDGDGDSKCVEVTITANVVVDLYPDMFLGRDHSVEELREFIS